MVLKKNSNQKVINKNSEIKEVDKNNRNIKVLSLHWGFMPGGVSVYARYIEQVNRYGPLSMKSLCVNAHDWSFDKANAAYMNIKIIDIKGRWDFSWLTRIRSCIKEESPDLIMTHGFNGAFVAAMAAVGLKIPKVSSWHGDYCPTTIYQKISEPFIDRLQVFLFRHVVKEIVTVSHFSKKALMAKGLSENKIAVVHNGIPPEPVNCEYVRSIREELKISDDQVLVGTACRLASQKGLEWFMRAIAIVSKTHKNIRFVLWGEGPQEKYLRTLIKELGIDEFIQMPGYRSDIKHCLPALDIFCMSSYAEYFSIAMLEAMRAERPIVATSVGGNPEAIETGKEGILVPASDADALAKGIITLAVNRKLREDMALKAKNRFHSEFISEKMIEKTAGWLLSCARLSEKK